jgi:hypothetical protein
MGETMTTKREQYLDTLVALIKAVPDFPALVDRSIISAFAVEDSDVVVIHRGKEEPSHGMLGMADRTCEVLVSVITRSAVPERQADALLEMLHPLLIGFAAEGVIDVTEGVTDAPKFADADGKICMITTHYFMLYRTLAASLCS